MLLVTLIDGSLVALDHDSGQVLWRYDTGAPLVSARQTSAPSQGMNLVPGAYGELYAYQGLQQPSNPGLQVSRQRWTQSRLLCTQLYAWCTRAA